MARRLADGVWTHQGEQERAHYRRAEAPGQVVDKPRSGFPSTDPEADEAPVPREHFAVVSTTIDRIDWLHLHPDEHYRAEFEWTADRFQGRWLLP